MQQKQPRGGKIYWKNKLDWAGKTGQDRSNTGTRTEGKDSNHEEALNKNKPRTGELNKLIMETRQNGTKRQT